MTNTIEKIMHNGDEYIVWWWAVDDTAYWSSWDWEASKAPSQNAVYDKISSMDATLWTALQPLDNVSSLTNDAWYLTSAPVTSVNTKTWGVVLDADDISDSTTTNKFVTSSDKTTRSWKQDALVSWTNIKTINSNSILWSWDLVVSWIPSWWTTWQVLMMTANWPAWVTPADSWFIILDPNSPIVIKKLRVWTETQYNNLQSYSNDTRYDTI